MGQSLHRALVCGGGEIAPASAPASSNPACSSSNPTCSSSNPTCSSSNPACSSEHRSARIQSLIEKKDKYERAADAEIEASKDTWSEVRERKVESDEQSSAVANRAFFRSLREEYVGGSEGSFFEDWSDVGIELGEKIAEGAQGAIHTIRGMRNVVKVFKLEGWSLEELHKTWSPGMLNYLKVHSKSTFHRVGVAAILKGILFKDGSFGFVMRRHWGDLRKMIDQRMIHNGNHAPPFNVRRTFDIMLSIAFGMRELHKNDIVHGDLKAANVLILPSECVDPFTDRLQGNNQVMDLSKNSRNNIYVRVADFECSGGVVGTGFWRAPEILSALRNHCFEPNLCTEKSDVYSFGMTCYEIVTAKIPFEGEPDYKYDIVLGGKRPELPSGTPQWIRSMVERCWHHEPSKRPSFQELVEKFKVIKNDVIENGGVVDNIFTSMGLQLLEDLLRDRKF